MKKDRIGTQLSTLDGLRKIENRRPQNLYFMSCNHFQSVINKIWCVVKVLMIAAPRLLLLNVVHHYLLLRTVPVAWTHWSNIFIVCLMFDDWLRLDCCSIWKTQTRSIQNSDSQMELSERVLGTVAAGAGLSMCAFWYLGLKVHLKDDVLWLPCTNDVNFMIGWEQNESLLMIFSHEWPRYLTLVLTVVVVVVLLRLNDRLVKAKWIHHDNST